MPINSRDKGAKGELEFVHVLNEHGLDSYRGQQFRGGAGSPDVVCLSLTDIHFEVKRVEKGNPYIWIEQAIRDAGPGKLPVVAHRKSHQEWLGIIRMEDLLRLLILREKHYDDLSRQGQMAPVQSQSEGNGPKPKVRRKSKKQRKIQNVQPKPKRNIS